ncbi:MAG TPA: GNAT family N-acetyltransferase [Chitinophagaceae bacterium]|jgi:ribosomal protein S18 acetylase RimI-like enzyme|nr:GNAT family N-acetyltransferase [Chitinophagaceae bacterium]
MHTLIENNFDLHARYIPGRTPGMQVRENEWLSYTDSGLSCDTFNIIHIRTGAGLPASVLEEAVHYYRQRAAAFTLWVSSAQLNPSLEALLMESGLQRANTEPGMVLNLASLSLQEETHPHDLRLARTPQEISDFAEVVAANWNPPDLNVRAYYEQTTPSFLRNEHGIRLALCYLDAKPVSVIELFPSDNETVGLYSLATLESCRGKGIGSALLRFALRIAQTEGYRTALLQASEDGIGLYRRLGFAEQCVYYEYQ